MARLLIVLIAAITLAVPAPVWAQASAEAARERAQEARQRAGALDTVVTFDARGTFSVNCPGGDVIVTGADHFFTKQLDAVEETMRTWAEELLEG